MFNLEEKQCPFFQKTCLTTRCTMWDGMLSNCLIRLTPHNLYKLDRTIAGAMPPGPQPGPWSPPKA